MKTQRICVKKNEKVEVFVRRKACIKLRYSTSVLGDEGPMKEQTKFNSGLAASINLVGPCTIAVVKSARNQSR